jgi:hypothetical protein
MLVLASAFMGHVACEAESLRAEAIDRGTSSNSALSIEAALESRRFVKDEHGHAIFASPERDRYVFELVSGNIKENGVVAELFSGTLDSFTSAEPKLVARLFTRGLGSNNDWFGSSGLTALGFNLPVWIDNRRIVMYWDDARDIRQVVALDTTSGDVQFLTRHPTHVIAFSRSLTGSLIYGARHDYSKGISSRDRTEGFTVNEGDAMGLLAGYADGIGMWDFMNDFDWWVASPSHTEPRKVISASVDVNRFPPADSYVPNTAPSHRFSPDGLYAIVEMTPKSVPENWGQYTDAFHRVRMQERTKNERGFFARQIQQLFVVAIATCEARPLWDAPYVAPGKRLSERMAWSPDGKSVALAPTFLPVKVHNTRALAGHSAAVVEIKTGIYVELPLAGFDPSSVVRVDWNRDDRIVLHLSAGDSRVLRRQSGRWILADPDRPQAAKRAERPVTLEVREDMNTPPRVYAVLKETNQDRLIFDPNPELKERFALGRVELIQWNDKEGRSWHGRLYYPAGYEKGRHYPLVVQLYEPATSDAFSLYGPQVGLGPGLSVFLAQPLASNGIAVLQAEYPDSNDLAPTALSELMRTRESVAAYEVAIDKLVTGGLVDRSKVGLIGWSHTGWTVEYAISNSKFPYAAAVAVDNKDGGYVQTALSGWMPGYGEALNGGPPFGSGLLAWMANSPGMRIDSIRTPLQLIVTGYNGSVGGSILWTGWEVFSRLRYLELPAELYVAPEIERGTHAPQNPHQLLAIQNRALDWWRFWLQDYEDSARTQNSQYMQWRKMRDQRAAAMNQADTPH